jgi:hypothetical protein
MSEWLKVHEKIVRDPVVATQSDELGVDRRIIAWSWVTLWNWAREQTTTGFIARTKMSHLDDMVGIPGFTLHAGEWLVWRDGGVEFTKWELHNSEGAKERAENARRNKGYRQRKKSRDGIVTEEHHVRDTKTTPEEKRREENRNHQHQCTPSGDGGGGGEETQARRKALRAAGINPGPVLDELTATNLRPSQIGLIAQQVKSQGGKGGVIVNALRDAAAKPPDERKPTSPHESAPAPPVDPEAEKQRLRARLETASGAARRMIENELSKMEGAA